MLEVMYTDDGNIAMFNGKLFRRDKRTGYYLASQGDASGKRKRLHISVWEFHNGEIPRGNHIHHVDYDKSNNEISNLQMMTNSEHQTLHGKAMTEEHKEKLRKNLIEKAVPKSKAWHASDEGREWHKKHGKESWSNRKPTKYECTYCGKEYETLRIYGENENHFCSNNCKSAFRRKMGYDNVDIPCEVCGEIFTANKYLKRTKCSKCARKRKIA